MVNTFEPAPACRTLSGAAAGPRCYRCEAARTRPGVADCAGVVHLAPVAPAPRADLVRWEPESSLELTVVWCDAAGVEHTAIATVYDDGVRLTGGADPGADSALLEEQLDEDYRGRQRLWGRASETAERGQGGDELRAPAGEEEQVTMLDRPARIAAIRAAFAVSPAIILEYRGDSTPDLALHTGDPSEPGKLRVTYLAPDGPRGHVSRRDLEGCIEHVADLCPAAVRPATEDEVIAWTSTPAYVAGAAQVAQVQRENEARRQAAQEGAAP